MDNIEKIRQYIKEHDSEAFLISNQTNEFYISGFKGKGYLVIDEENQYLLTTTDYQEQAKLETSGFKLVDLEEQSLSDFLTKYKNIIIESINLSAYEYQKIIDKNISIMPSNKINEIRMIKSSNEINKIKKVAKITTQTYEYISSIIKPGLTERDVANEIDFYGRKSGAQQLAYETKVTSGERTALPNAETSDKVIKDKELVTVKFAFEIDGYTSEIAHTLAVGDVKKELKELLDVAQKAQAFGCRFANKVETFGDLDRIIRGYVIDAGYGEFLDHVTGHGIGLNAIDNPIIRTSNNDQVQSFIPFIIEPGVYIPGKGGAIMEGQYYLDKNNKIICLNI